jgi:hypothetical protein
MHPIRDWLPRLRELEDEGKTGLFSLPGCISRLEWVLSLVSLVMIVAFAIAGYAEGVVVTIAIVLVGFLLFVVLEGQSR